MLSSVGVIKGLHHKSYWDQPLRIETCAIAPTEASISIVGKTCRGDGHLLTLEAHFIKEIAPT